MSLQAVRSHSPSMLDGRFIPFLKNKLLLIFLLFGATGCMLIEGLYSSGKEPDPPKDHELAGSELKIGDDGERSLGKNWLRKNEAGIWELYVEGAPYERGYAIGELSRPLLEEQERIFIERLQKMIPDRSYLNFLKYLVAFSTRRVDEHVSEEQKLEVLGVSRSASDSFRHVGPAFYRMMNYHAAHDIGHAIQNMNLVEGPMVGCSAFSVNGEASEDGDLLLGRNFDFHMGDRFSRNKMVAFYKPDDGIPFMMITWPGMTGAVSGMNREGLSVTLNAARSDIPRRVGTPVSIIGRRILQEASDIQEAFEVASRYECFVSESFLIGSAKDEESAIIEKDPSFTSLYRPGKERLISTNHFQSEPFRDMKRTEEHKRRNPTDERYERLKELLEKEGTVDPSSAAEVLRDHRGIGGEKIGLGNEIALNQFLAHHSILFKPEEKKVWVSSFPYQLGEYVAYDLDEVFRNAADGPRSFTLEKERIPPSELLNDGTYDRFKRYKELRKGLLERIGKVNAPIPDSATVRSFIQSNPEYFEVYRVLGDLYRDQGDHEEAVGYYRKGLEKEIPREAQRSYLRKRLKGSLGKIE